MSTSLNRLGRIAMAIALVALIGACTSANGSGSKAAPTIAVNPGGVQAKAKTPPPATAKPATSIGKAPTARTVANKAGDTDSFWVERLDVDGDGNMEDTQLLWDDEDKVLFAYAEVDVMTDDGAATAAMLVGVNGEGNPRGRPAGSGSYAGFFDAGEGGAEVSGLFGCRFDADGKATDWAAVALDSAGDTIVARDQS